MYPILNEVIHYTPCSGSRKLQKILKFFFAVSLLGRIIPCIWMLSRKRYVYVFAIPTDITMFILLYRNVVWKKCLGICEKLIKTEESEHETTLLSVPSSWEQLHLLNLDYIVISFLLLNFLLWINTKIKKKCIVIIIIYLRTSRNIYNPNIHDHCFTINENIRNIYIYLCVCVQSHT